MDLPFSPSCERNRAPILEVLKRHLPTRGTLLEIGSGTGQHAAYFAPEFPELVWQTSDLPEHHPGISGWIAQSGATNLRQPVALDASVWPWPVAEVSAVYSANTAHIMPWEVTQAMLRGACRVLSPGGRLCLYGPFNYGGSFTSESNARFEQWLKARDPRMGVRDFEAVVDVLGAGGMDLVEDCEMPANNRTLVFERR